MNRAPWFTNICACLLVFVLLLNTPPKKACLEAGAALGRLRWSFWKSCFMGAESIKQMKMKDWAPCQNKRPRTSVRAVAEENSPALSPPSSVLDSWRAELDVSTSHCFYDTDDKLIPTYHSGGGGRFIKLLRLFSSHSVWNTTTLISNPRQISAYRCKTHALAYRRWLMLP